MNSAETGTAQPAAQVLYCSKTSPFARKVRVLVRELGLTEQLEERVVDPFDPSPEFLACNPLSKIPALQTSKGLLLADSKLICDYLLKQRSGVLETPRGNARWLQLQRAYLAEGVIEAAVACVLEKRRPESIIYTSFLDRQAANIRRTLDVLEQQVDQLAAEQPWLAEITTGVALGYLDFRLPYLEWREGRDGLSAWFRQFAQRSAMRTTQPPTS